LTRIYFSDKELAYRKAFYYPYSFQ